MGKCFRENIDRLCRLVMVFGDGFYRAISTYKFIYQYTLIIPMKLISWNVNGIRAALKKDFPNFVKKENPDILLLQETKARPQDVTLNFPEYPHQFWNTAEKAGYSGTAVFSKIPPLGVTYKIGIPEHDKEGRITTLEFSNYFLVDVYVPNSGRGLPRLQYRSKWDKDFLIYLKRLEQKKPVIVCGDFNVAHTSIDLANPKSNYNKTAGYTQIEIDGFITFLKAGFIDTFREFHKEPAQYTFWTYLFNAREKNIGWRIDYFLISPALRAQLKDAFILPTVMGSDHCPIGIEIKN